MVERERETRLARTSVDQNIIAYDRREVRSYTHALPTSGTTRGLDQSSALQMLTPEFAFRRLARRCNSRLRASSP